MPTPPALRALLLLLLLLPTSLSLSLSLSLSPPPSLCRPRGPRLRFSSLGAPRASFVLPPVCLSRARRALRQLVQCPTVLPQVAATRELTPRIVGGTEPHPSLQSHMVAFVRSSLFVCSGSLISARWAITAAHCNINSDFRVSLGSTHVTDGVTRKVARVFRHPSYNPKRQDSPYDIALVLLDGSAPSSTRFIRVNNNASVPELEAFSRAFGYGQLREKELSAPVLRQVDVPVVPMPVCKDKYSMRSAPLAQELSDELQLCAGRPEGGCDACQGDSGGPLAVFDDEGNLVQIGIVSFGIGCARPNFPGVYTRLSFFQQWMIDTGAEFTRSTDGRVIESQGVNLDESGGFSVAGLNLWQSIAVVVSAGVVGLAFIGFLVYPFVARRSARRPPRDDDHDIDSTDSATPPPSAAHADHGYGHYSVDASQDGSLGPRPPQTAPVPEPMPVYDPMRYEGAPLATHAPSEQHYEGQLMPPYSHPNVPPPYTELDRFPPYMDVQTPAPVYQNTVLESGYATPWSGDGIVRPPSLPETHGDTLGDVPPAPLYPLNNSHTNIRRQ
ncbi:unnamed protein product [Chondrus crispus]|uniref:Peptidase S1 domain-containing protein n=1 Tax=Chondrus crispus TaxID=2769 RepID=R7QQD9_CHOCR|nr:unnamed protein product [Chondrus crispus]CDF39590.1 unnamed protein product [Chondrus crispus]|eukprot:XP_005709884.1 unnamed protein product [Chondrus crispus]